MAQCDVLQGELSAGSEGRGENVKDELEHPDMLYPGSRNINDAKADEIFGRDSDRTHFIYPVSILPALEVGGWWVENFAHS